MPSLIQPQFKILVFNGKNPTVDKNKGLKSLTGTGVRESANKGYLDITNCVAANVVYEEQASLLNTLNFSVDKNASTLLYYFWIGQSVIFYGGHYDDSNSVLRPIFSGTVTRIRTRFTDSGRVTFSVECMNYGYTKLGKNYKNFRYPDAMGGRSFAKADVITLEQIVRGIANENHISIGKIELSPEARKITYTKNDSECQKDETDWVFLTKLAQDSGCNLWMSFEDGEEKLNFVSLGLNFRKQEDICFVYPLYGEVTDIRDSEMIDNTDSAYKRPRMLRDVSVDEDISAAYAVQRTATYFDRETGEYKEAVSRIETDKEGRTTAIFYEFDEAKVAEIDEKDPELAKEIRMSSPTSLEWGTPGDGNPRHASYYYREIKRYSDSQAVFDKAFFGITVTAKCNQDLDIKSQRTYKIRGILSYHSTDLESSFFLRGLKHIWGSDGCWTELDFIR